MSKDNSASGWFGWASGSSLWCTLFPPAGDDVKVEPRSRHPPKLRSMRSKPLLAAASSCAPLSERRAEAQRQLDAGVQAVPVVQPQRRPGRVRAERTDEVRAADRARQKRSRETKKRLGLNNSGRAFSSKAAKMQSVAARARAPQLRQLRSQPEPPPLFSASHVGFDRLFAKGMVPEPGSAYFGGQLPFIRHTNLGEGFKTGLRALQDELLEAVRVGLAKPVRHQWGANKGLNVGISTVLGGGYGNKSRGIKGSIGTPHSFPLPYFPPSKVSCFE